MFVYYTNNMELTDIFKKTLRLFLDGKPRGTQSEMADSIGINRSNLNGYIKDKEPMSESRRIKIAEYLGFEYTEFINLGNRLWQSDEPWLWSLRAIYLDEQRFRDLLNDSGITETRFKGIFNVNKSLPLMPEEKEKILEATGFTEKDFLDFGRREILKNPKMKWDLGGMVRQIGTRTTMPYKHENPEASDEQSSELDTITQEHFEIVKKFKFKERLKKINEDLLIIEQNPDALRDVEAYLRGLAAGIKYSSGHSAPNHPPRSEGNLKNGTE